MSIKKNLNGIRRLVQEVGERGEHKGDVVQQAQQHGRGQVQMAIQ